MRKKSLGKKLVEISRAQDAGTLSDELVVINLADENLQKIFTPKKLQLLNFILAGPELTVSEIAARLKRKKEAVSTDLKLLKKYGLVEMPREGRSKKPIASFQAIQLVPARGQPFFNKSEVTLA
jgi:predicted transcriptional regulator